MIAGIVLAAGASERMGSPKALLPIAGHPAVGRVASSLLHAGCEPVVVVVGRHAAEIRAGVPACGWSYVDHPGWSAGRTSSIQAGLAAVPADVDAIVLALVDMPLVRPSTVEALVRSWRSREPRPDVLAPRHGERHGHPLVLARATFPAIAALAPDAPLRDLLRRLDRAALAVDDPGVLIDLDEPGDLVRALHA